MQDTDLLNVSGPLKTSQLNQLRAQALITVELIHPVSSYLVNLTDTRRSSGAYPTILLRVFSSSNGGVAAMVTKIDEIVHAFGEEMERIVFNSNGKAKTMDLAKAWLRARLEELVQEMRAECQPSDQTKIVKQDCRTVQALNS
jgi:hypothetical protein